jgi:hypothetical protein
LVHNKNLNGFVPNLKEELYMYDIGLSTIVCVGPISLISNV